MRDAKWMERFNTCVRAAKRAHMAVVYHKDSTAIIGPYGTAILDEEDSKDFANTVTELAIELQLPTSEIEYYLMYDYIGNSES